MFNWLNIELNYDIYKFAPIVNKWNIIIESIILKHTAFDSAVSCNKVNNTLNQIILILINLK